ncbi:hypothetical protein AVEN_43443-1 [Araneus ventricosus]|uniref:C2H2-type domain-containing protein n=1 Tax=Araneus ventricosus TaxID=182803 RepID=A0A4Y2JI34_ARAVE|nr:hypothetical protein AVEN_43443-1 [Araneus ventricosus]
MSRLLGDLTKYNCDTFYCYSCLHRFSAESLLKDHLPYCNEHSPQRIVMPETVEDSVMEFKQHKFSQPIIFPMPFMQILKRSSNHCRIFQARLLPTSPVAMHISS